MLANGSVIEVTATNHEDLFRALKGGGSSFGIVTHFRLDVFPLAFFHAGFVTYAWSSLSQVMHTLQSFNENAHLDPRSSITLSVGFDPALGGPTITVALARVGETLDSPILTPFFRIPHVFGSRQQMKHSELAELLDANNPSGFRYALAQTIVYLYCSTDKVLCNLNSQYKGTFTVKNDASLTTYIAQTVMSRGRQGFSSSPDPGFRVGFLVQPLTAGHLDVGRHRGGGNSMGFHESEPLLRKSHPHPHPHPCFAIISPCSPPYPATFAEEFPNPVIFIEVRWCLPTHSDLYHTIINDLIQTLEHEAAERGLRHPFKYLNYASAKQDMFASYGQNERMVLRQVRDRYDNTHFFKERLSLPFKL